MRLKGGSQSLGFLFLFELMTSAVQVSAAPTAVA